MANLETLFGFAAKGGKLSFGFSAAKTAILGGKAKAVAVCRDVSEKSQKEISFFAAKKNVPVFLLKAFDMQALSDAVGRKCGMLSINDSSFADAIRATVEGGNANEQ